MFNETLPGICSCSILEPPGRRTTQRDPYRFPDGYSRDHGDGRPETTGSRFAILENGNDQGVGDPSGNNRRRDDCRYEQEGAEDRECEGPWPSGGGPVGLAVDVSDIHEWYYTTEV
jgi:hypothetical protein